MNDIDDELNVILRQERRQKIAAVNEELNSGFDRQSVTSAPSIKHVDGKSGFEAREKREFQIPKILRIPPQMLGCNRKTTSKGEFPSRPLCFS